MSTFTIVEYQADWPARFLEAAAELRAAFAGEEVHVEHIGSTAVPGLCAKPIIDILLGAEQLPKIEASVSSISRLGYIYRPDYETELPERRYFVRQAGRGPRVNLHAVVEGAQFWRRHLAFRDALRADPTLQHQYGALKRRLVAAHAGDRSAYTAAKSPFIAQVLASRHQARGASGESAA